jgi:hypothetical protein
MYANKRRVTPIKVCKFCKDAGKSEAEYTSHFLRESKDPTSRIICPTLLAIECRYCSKRGHTVSKCSKLAKDKERGAVSTERAVRKPEERSYSPANHFDLLSDNGDSDNEEATISTCMDCDTVGSASSSGSTLSYADILRSQPNTVVVIETKVPVGSRLSILDKARMMRSWADNSDSDDE